MSQISLRSVVPVGLFCLAVASVSGTTIQDFDNAKGSLAPGRTVLAYAGVVGSSTQPLCLKKEHTLLGAMPETAIPCGLVLGLRTPEPIAIS